MHSHNGPRSLAQLSGRLCRCVFSPTSGGSRSIAPPLARRPHPTPLPPTGRLATPLALRPDSDARRHYTFANISRPSPFRWHRYCRLSRISPRVRSSRGRRYERESLAGIGHEPTATPRRDGARAAGRGFDSRSRGGTRGEISRS